HADIVAGQTAGKSHARFVVAGEIGADDLPGVALIGGDVDVLAAHVYLVVIVRRNRQRELPIEAVLDLGRGGAAGLLGPDLDVARLVIALVEHGDDAAHAARSRCAAPDDVGVDGIGRGEAALTPGHLMPRAARDLSAASASAAFGCSRRRCT